jgi:anti-sigma factor ChrR (cupin superfamily)
MRILYFLLAASAVALSQTPAVLFNVDESKWTRSPKDPEGTGSIVLREDSKTGALELLARYEPGHVFKPHWHDSNERLILFEGRLSLGDGKVLEPGGYAFLPAREVQHMSCISQSRCTFYVAWDGNSKSHAPDK